MWDFFNGWGASGAVDPQGIFDAFNGQPQPSDPQDVIDTNPEAGGVITPQNSV